MSITDTSAQLALAYDASGYVTFGVDTGDDLTIVPSGGDIDITGTLAISSTLGVTGVGTFTTDLVVDTDTLFVDASEDNVGIGTSTPSTTVDLDIYNTATSTLALSTDAGDKGSCLSLYDATGSAIYCYVENGGVTFTCSTNSCE